MAVAAPIPGYLREMAGRVVRIFFLVSLAGAQQTVPNAHIDGMGKHFLPSKAVKSCLLRVSSTASCPVADKEPPRLMEKKSMLELISSYQMKPFGSQRYHYE